MENAISVLRTLKKERESLSNKFNDAMQQKNISKALEIKVRQDSICDEIINVYDSMIKLQNNE
ncbi:hypothetical protein [Faecalibacillus intestinalis]|uniref:hypothetical protein n=1 Tax=Faecalibacillus intestinalis TaxID=1982626 RepID=UPI000E531D1B|nr:hypothetical protein [Faecalibacillus intestinalis]RGF54568.1 hypothetical protein DWZ88_13910 [Coprobacillus sp. AF36-10BH]